MDFAKVPIGFGMELAQDEAAMQRYAILTQEEKRAYETRAQRAKREGNARDRSEHCGRNALRLNQI